jgi:hypothetical protein
MSERILITAKQVTPAIPYAMVTYMQIGGQVAHIAAGFLLVFKPEMHGTQVL